MRKRNILPIFLALLAVHCGDDRVAGGYDDVENPALSVILRTEDGRDFGPGQVKLYARYQNPARDTVPLLARTVAAGAAAAFTDSMVLAAMEAARLRGTPWHDRDSVEFNLVASEQPGQPAASEAYAGRFVLVRIGSGYIFLQRREGSVQYADTKGVLAVAPRMSDPVLKLRGQVGARGLDIGIASVFVPGTGYAAEVAVDGTFEFARIAGGRYELKALSRDEKVYSGVDSLITSEEYSASDWSEADLIWIE